VRLNKPRRLVSWRQTSQDWDIFGKQLELIFHTSIRIAADESTGISVVIRNDPVDKAQQQDLNEPEFCLDVYLEEIQSRFLVIYADNFYLYARFLHAACLATEPAEVDNLAFSNFQCERQNISLESWALTTRLRGSKIPGKFSFPDGFIIDYLLLIYTKENGSMAERGTALESFMPLDDLHILDELKPKSRIVLA